MPKGIGLRQSEIAAAIGERGAQFPPILDVPRVASLLGRSRKTIYFWISQGRLDGTFRKHGKHLFFWRDRVIDRIFNAPDWKSKNESESQHGPQS